MRTKRMIGTMKKKMGVVSKKAKVIEVLPKRILLFSPKKVAVKKKKNVSY